MRQSRLKVVSDVFRIQSDKPVSRWGRNCQRGICGKQFTTTITSLFWQKLSEHSYIQTNLLRPDERSLRQDTIHLAVIAVIAAIAV